MFFGSLQAILRPTMVVRMRRNRSQTAKRRSHHALTAARAQRCECGALRMPHRACASCGRYNGRVVTDVVAQAEKTQKRAKRREKELMASGQITPDTAEKKEQKASKKAPKAE